MGHEMSNQKSLEAARKERGAQLRALVVSWHEGKTFLEALAAQQVRIDDEGFEPADDWSVMADEILGQYTAVASQPKMEWPDEKPPEPEGPKLVIP